jgi:hypothetical protein
LDPAQGVRLLTELSTQSRVNFVTVDRFIGKEFDDHSLFVFNDIFVQTSFNIMWPKQYRINPIREGVCRDDHIISRSETEHFLPALMVQARESLRRLAHVLIHQTIATQYRKRELLPVNPRRERWNKIACESTGTSFLVIVPFTADRSRREILPGLA